MTTTDRRTFSRADIERSRAEWDAGEFSEEWTPWRVMAAHRGILFPPAGSKWDSWEDDSPSQRALLIQAIRDAEDVIAAAGGNRMTPTILARAITRSSSWTDVIANLIGYRGAMREARERADRKELARAKLEDPSHVAATESLDEIFRRMGARK